MSEPSSSEGQRQPDDSAGTRQDAPSDGDAPDRSGVEDSFDAEPEVIFETTLPLREEELTASQAALLARLLKARASHSRPIRRRMWLLNGAGTLVAATLVLGVVAAYGRAGRQLVCCTACVVVPAMVGLVALLTERWVWRPLRWTLQPWSCPACGYELAGLVDRRRLNCPECGADCDIEGRRHVVMDTEALLAEIRAAGGDLAWAVKANPGLRDLDVRACADLLERAELEARRPLRARLGSAVLIAFGLLLLAGGMLWAGVGILKTNWLGALGGIPIVAGIWVLLSSPKGKRQRLSEAIAEGLGRGRGRTGEQESAGMGERESR